MARTSVVGVASVQRPGRKHLRTQQRQQHRRRRAVPFFAGTALLLILWLLHEQVNLRDVEAKTTALISARLLGVPVSAFGDKITVQSTHGDWLRFVITPECSTVLLLVPFLAFCALIVTVSLPKLTRGAVMVIVGSCALCLVNVARLTLVVAGTRTGTLAIYPLLHTGIGTVIVLVGAGATILLALRICFPKQLGER